MMPESFPPSEPEGADGSHAPILYETNHPAMPITHTASRLIVLYTQPLGPLVSAEVLFSPSTEAPSAVVADPPVIIRIRASSS